MIMSRICPTCGQPIPEPTAGTTPAATDSPAAPPPRGFAAAVLGVLYAGYRIAAPARPLAERLYSERQDVRDRALDELSGLEAAARAPVIEALVQNAAGTDPRKRACTLDALGRLKPPAPDARAVLPGLQTLMREPDTRTALLALAAARHVAPSPADVQSASLDLLAAQGARLSTTEYLAVLSGIGLSLSPTGEPVRGIAAMLGSLVLSTPDPVLRSSALGLIAQLSATAQAEAGGIVAAGAFSSTVILQALADPIPANRSALLAGLMRVIPASFDLAPSLSLLAANSSTVLRATAADLLGGLKPASSTAWTAINVLLKDADAGVRTAAVAAVKPRMSELPKRVVTTMLGLLKDKDAGVRAAVADALAALPTARVKKALADYGKEKAAADAAAAAAAAAAATSPSATTSAASAVPAGGASAGDEELSDPGTTDPALTGTATPADATAPAPDATEPALADTVPPSATTAEPATAAPAEAAPATTAPAAPSPAPAGTAPATPAPADRKSGGDQPASSGSAKDL